MCRWGEKDERKKKINPSDGKGKKKQQTAVFALRGSKEVRPCHEERRERASERKKKDGTERENPYVTHCS